MISKPALAWRDRTSARRALCNLLLVACCALFVPAGAHAYCFGITDPIAPPSPPGHVCGTLTKLGFNGSYFVAKPAGTTYVKICPAGSTFGCSTTTTGSYLDGYNRPVQAWAFPRYRAGATNYLSYDFYAWGLYDTDYWGSSTKPLRQITIGPGLEGISIYMPPRPLDPAAIYPSGTTVPNNYTVRWKSGIDLDRKPYPALYEVWFKFWPFGGVEPATWSLSTATLPCHDDGSGPDASGNCSTYVYGPQPPGNWKWYVVANLDISSQVYYPNTIFSTQSNWVGFTQPE